MRTPRDAVPRLLLIELLLRNKDNKQALAAAQNAVTALPNSPELLAALGRVQQASGDVNQAIATYSKLIALQPLSPQPHIRLAEAQVASKNIGSRAKLAKGAGDQAGLPGSSAWADHACDRRQALCRSRQVGSGVQELHPKESVGYAMEGDIAAAQKNWDAAAVAYRSGLQRAASTALAIKLNSVLLASGKTSESDRFAAAWLKDHPKDQAFRSHLGDLALARKDYEAAEKTYLSVLEIQPNNAIALNNLAWVAGHMKKEGAIAYAEKANQIAPNQSAFMDTWATLLADRKEFAKAIDLQQKALELQPSNASLRLNLARIYVKSGDNVRAKAELDALAKLGEKFSGQPEVSAMLNSL